MGNNLEYDIRWYPSRSVSDQNADFGVLRQHLSATTPLWSNGIDIVTFELGLTTSHFSTEAILPDTGVDFPDDLTNVNFGLNYIHRFENGWTGILKTGFGSASDKPFHSIDEMNTSITALLRVPSRNLRDSWMFGVAYSSAGNLNFPIPLIAYAWNPSDQFQMNVGVPFSMTWKPTDNWVINATYIPLTNVLARATYRASDQVHFYGGYENMTESYFLVDRTNQDDRFFVFEQRLIAGIRWDLFQNTSLDFNAGYAFDRHFGQAKNQGDSLQDEMSVDSTPFIGVDLQMRF